MKHIKQEQKWITVKGAKEHNLKNISVEIPKESLTIITGPSGSGKSSLALDVLYAEGQRRYMESLSSYARQFLGMPQKPDVESIDGLCPAIAIEQKTVGSNPRSTVGTITEVYDYLRVLFARIGKVHCPDCGSSVQACTFEEIARILEERYSSQFITVAAPYVQEKKGEFVQQLKGLFQQGWRRFVIDGQRYTFKSNADIDDLKLAKTYKHTIDVLVDAVEIAPEDNDYDKSRLRESIEKACKLAHGMCKVIAGDKSEQFSTQNICLCSGRSFPELEPRMFSFNSPMGACKECQGLGVVTDAQWVYEAGYEKYFEKSKSRTQKCSTCEGQRLNDLSLAVLVGGKNIYEIGEISIQACGKFFDALKLSTYEQSVAERLLGEITHRLSFLLDVGLGYLSLNRHARTLSGGEGQRIRLARQLGSALSGVLYVLDEPSIGLHQRDNDRLIDTLKRLRDHGNTVLVVEHDHDTMYNADYLIDMGPGAGEHGGQVVATGTPQEVCENPVSLTGAYLSGQESIERLEPLRQPESFLVLQNASTHNLQNIDVSFPLGVLCAISGVSGSGKSSLVMEELVPRMQHALKRKNKLAEQELEGIEDIENLVVIDQTPIGRTPRSNPATYLGVFDSIRTLFSQLPESNARGYAPGRFSFNVAGGRCKKCKGDGTTTVAMHFLPDVTLTCKACQGRRYAPSTLEIMYKGKNIADVLEMNATEAVKFFEHHTAIVKRLRLMCDVGLGYLQLGQSSTTLSGGEAQRIKLVNELAKRGRRTLYVLDEPTTGLHAHDVKRLIAVLDRLINKGNTIVVIEHNLDVLKVADYIIDMGPEGGDQGGSVVASGAPEQVAHVAGSHTGRYLKSILK